MVSTTYGFGSAYRVRICKKRRFITCIQFVSVCVSGGRFTVETDSFPFDTWHFQHRADVIPFQHPHRLAHFLRRRGNSGVCKYFGKYLNRCKASVIYRCSGPVKNNSFNMIMCLHKMFSLSKSLPASYVQTAGGLCRLSVGIHLREEVFEDRCQFQNVLLVDLSDISNPECIGVCHFSG